MPRGGVILNGVREKGFDLDGSWCGGCGFVLGSGSVFGGCRNLVGRSDQPDCRCNHGGDSDSRLGGRHLRFSGGASDDRALRVLRGRASFVALAFLLCFPFWADLSWAWKPQVVPILVKVMPDSIIKDSQGVSLAILGTGIDSGTVVWWNGTALETTVLGDTSAIAVVPDSLLTAVGVGVVELSNSDGVSNSVGVPIVDSMSTQLQPILYVLAGLLGAWAFINGFGSRL